MHFSAWDYVHQTLEKVGPRKRVLEIGARDVNGSVRRLFAGSDYVGLDVAEGPGVDVVAWPAEFVRSHRGKFDTVVCVETLEHDPDPEATIKAARSALVRKGGLFLVTAAGVGRKPHSGVDGGPIRQGEHYGNIDKGSLAAWLAGRFAVFTIDVWGERDIRATAWTSPPAAAEPADLADWKRRLAEIQFPR